MKVSIILAADCYVGGRLRTKGETVEVAEEIAASFAEKPELKTDVSSEDKPKRVRRSKKKQ